MRNTILFLSMILLVGFSSCQKKEQVQQKTSVPDGTHKALVEEVLQATSYTYLRVKEGNTEHWLAINKRKIYPGVAVYYKPELEMKNFKSKELQRTFKSIYFVSEINDQPGLNASGTARNVPLGHTESALKSGISVEQPKDGVSIARLSANRASYEGKIIKVRGQVTKYNPGIMGRNWVHIQDGTKDAHTFDLTVTTKDAVRMGQIVTFKGKIVLNKDFGAGYKYGIIMEEAVLQNP